MAEPMADVTRYHPFATVSPLGSLGYLHHSGRSWTLPWNRWLSSEKVEKRCMQQERALSSAE